MWSQREVWVKKAGDERIHTISDNKWRNFDEFIQSDKDTDTTRTNNTKNQEYHVVSANRQMSFTQIRTQ